MFELVVFLAERLDGGPGLREGAVGGLQLLLEALGGAGGLREGPLEHPGVVAEAPELGGVGLQLGRGVRQLAPELPRLLLRGLQLALQLHELLGLVGAALRVLQRLLQPLRLLPEPLALRLLQLQLALRLLQLQPQPAPLLLPLPRLLLQPALRLLRRLAQLLVLAAQQRRLALQPLQLRGGLLQRLLRVAVPARVLLQQLLRLVVRLPEREQLRGGLLARLLAVGELLPQLLQLLLLRLAVRRQLLLRPRQPLHLQVQPR